MATALRFNGVILLENECNNVVEAVMEALKSELRKEAQTLEICTYILSRTEAKLKSCRLDL